MSTATKVFVGDFDDWADVTGQFRDGAPRDEGPERDGAPVHAPRFVFAAYDTEDYEGTALVITSQDGKAYQVVQGSHCSCYGLEGQWEPSDHTVVEIEHMARQAGYGPYRDHSRAILDWLGAVLLAREPKAA